MIVSSRELMPVIRAALERGQGVSMQADGSSMSPFIRHGDTIELEPLRKVPRFGDIVLAKGADGRFLVHRIVRADHGAFLLRGDVQMECEGPFAANDILGKVILSCSRGRVRRHDRGVWRIAGKIWALSSPLGLYALRVALPLWRLGKAMCRRIAVGGRFDRL